MSPSLETYPSTISFSTSPRRSSAKAIDCPISQRTATCSSLSMDTLLLPSNAPVVRQFRDACHYKAGAAGRMTGAFEGNRSVSMLSDEQVAVLCDIGQSIAFADDRRGEV